MAALPETPAPTRDAIFAAYEADREDGRRPHLGASQIGKACERALWYDFRWTTPAQFRGRILRLFETGQLEEARLVKNLRRIGATVLEVDPETGRQWRVESHGGHFGGSLDAVALGLIEAPKTWHVLEFKTHSAKSFRELIAKGVAEAKSQHWAQMHVYMHLTGLTRAMYLAVCKDTDDLYVERVRADRDAAERLMAKAARVIGAARPPARISEDPAWFECRFCDHHEICHGDAAAAVTCRSCLHSTPVDGGWHCARWDQALDGETQRQACARHLFIPDPAR
jgi:PD-(D/E)XK nuclease superfamily